MNFNYIIMVIRVEYLNYAFVRKKDILFTKYIKSSRLC